MVKRPLLNQKSDFEEKIGRIRVARDFLVDGFNDIGLIAASGIDREHGNFIEQVFASDLSQKKAFILIGDNPIMFPYERIPKLLKLARAIFS